MVASLLDSIEYYHSAELALPALPRAVAVIAQPTPNAEIGSDTYQTRRDQKRLSESFLPDPV